MRTMMLGVALIAAACGTEAQQSHCDAPGEVTPGTIEINTGEQELGFGAGNTFGQEDTWTRVPKVREVPACEEPTFLVVNVGPVDDPEGEFLGVAATVTAGNCGVTVESVTFDLRMQTEEGYTVPLSGPTSLLASTRIATGNPADVTPGGRTADALTTELSLTPVGALAWSTYDPIAVPAHESRIIGLFAELGPAASGRYLFSVVGGSASFDTGDRTHGLRGPLLGLSFHVSEPEPMRCTQLKARVWGLVPAANPDPNEHERVFVAEIGGSNCDISLDHIEIATRSIVDVNGSGDEWAMYTNFDQLANDVVVTVYRASYRSHEIHWEEPFATTTADVPGLASRRTIGVDMVVPAGAALIIEVYLMVNADAPPGEYLFALEGFSGTVVETGDAYTGYGFAMPVHGMPFSITE
ncbi:MAG: hypothetical protein Q7S96_02130 [bacterium]|nr:hypothetical protein [bacterium]